MSTMIGDDISTHPKTDEDVDDRDKHQKCRYQTCREYLGYRNVIVRK